MGLATELTDSEIDKAAECGVVVVVVSSPPISLPRIAFNRPITFERFSICSAIIGTLPKGTTSAIAAELSGWREDDKGLFWQIEMASVTVTVAVAVDVAIDINVAVAVDVFVAVAVVINVKLMHWPEEDDDEEPSNNAINDEDKDKLEAVVRDDIVFDTELDVAEAEEAKEEIFVLAKILLAKEIELVLLLVSDIDELREVVEEIICPLKAIWFDDRKLVLDEEFEKVLWIVDWITDGLTLNATVGDEDPIRLLEFLLVTTKFGGCLLVMVNVFVCGGGGVWGFFVFPRLLRASRWRSARSK